MTRFTVHVTGGPGLGATHPDVDHQRRLLEVAGRLGARNELAWCGGCKWYLRRPLRLGDATHFAFQHVVTAHFDALLDGRACIDPDLIDGGEAHLAERMRAVPRRLRPLLAEVTS